LDLLNAENELYTAKRAYVQAEEDLATAVVRTYAGMGTLVASLGLKRPEGQDLAPEAQDWGVGGDGSSRCPLVPIAVGGASFADLDQKAAPLAAPRTPAAVPAPVAAPAAPAAPVTPAQSAAISVQRLQDWAAAWMAKDVERYMSFYSESFKPEKTD